MVSKLKMNKTTIKKAKAYVLQLFAYDGRKSLFELSGDNCSEVSRLLALWFRNTMPSSNIFIAKGKIKKRFHDLILIENNNRIFIIDPTVWQFFRKKRTIYMGSSQTIKLTMHLLSDIYGGKWSISERVTKYSQKEIIRLKKTIRCNIKN